jgi:RHH-type proline utilization regulon transcriptional repressor/proline dehydrogenase/delta 1-pyrroline-5-carboxylate dehydrogenase
VARPAAADIEAVVDAARDALPEWRVARASERAALLRAAADRLEARRFEFAAAMVHESGKPWGEADGDVTEAVDYLRYYAWHGERIAEEPVDLSVAGERSELVYEGRGVAAVISPWNFPLAILAGMASAALAVGCPVILKPAEQSPIVAGMLARLLIDAGLPAGVVNYLPGGGEAGAELVEHPGVNVIAFTGSNAVGMSILEAAARVRPGQAQFKHVIAELGGKNAIIVDDDADLDAAVSGVVTSAFGFAGQKCSACSRVITVGTASEEFERRLAAAVSSLSCGDPRDPYTVVPPVISAEARERIEGAIALGKRTARLVAAGQPEGPGHFVAPHVFADVPFDSPLWRDEIFGPVLVLSRAETFGEALSQALDSRFALTGGVYSRHPGHVERARRGFRVGNLYINRVITGAVVGRHPFGGFGMSGLGDKAGGPEYVRQFMVPRVVTENTMRRGFASDE